MIMRKTLFLYFLFLLSVFQVYSQQGLVWWRCIGGSDVDQHYGMAISRSGLIVSAGRTRSNNGDIVGQHGPSDALLSALNKDGSIAWLKVIGGSENDALIGADVDTLADGNLMMAFTAGSNNGDISGNQGGWDFVFRKYSQTGTLIWSKTYGGAGQETISEIKATADGGVIAVGTTSSNNSGDVGINHSSGTRDVWIVKLNASGNIEWQKCFGGSLDEQTGSITTAPDGGYYFSTMTQSTDGDLTGLVAAGTAMAWDLWLVKINASGVIQWSKQIGGSDNEEAGMLLATSSAIYVTFGSRSADRDIPSNQGLHDLVVFKYNHSGTLIWKKVYSSPGSVDSPGGIEKTPDGNLYVIAVTYSHQFGGFPIVNPNTNEGQALLLRIDSLNGNLQWVRSYGGTERDFAAGIKVDVNGDVYITGSTNSNNFDVSGNHGDYDAMVFRLSAGNRIFGNVFIDRNNNNTFDASDSRMNDMPVQTSKNGNVYATTFSSNAAYSLEVDTGLYSTRIKFPFNSPYYTVVPDTFQCNFTGPYQTCSKNLQVKPIAGIRDLRIYTFPLGPARPAFHTDYLLVGYNVGTDTVSSGIITWKKDPRVTVTNYSIPPAAIIGDSVVWSFANFKPLDSIKIIIKVTTPPPPQLTAPGLLKYTARIRPIDTDLVPLDNDLILYNRVVGPLDPNDKMNLLGDTLVKQQVENGEYIGYVIRFQNVGTAPAFDIVIRDTLTTRLQTHTFEPLASSHPYHLQVTGNVAVWKFTGINLPDSVSNEPKSHGFIAFRLKPVSTLPVGDSIVNKAAIYFDYNDAVITNPNVLRIINNAFVTSVTSIDRNDNSILVYPNPVTGGFIHVIDKENNQLINSWKLINVFGQTLVSNSLALPGNNIDIPTLTWPNGIYILEITTRKKIIYKRIVILK